MYPKRRFLLLLAYVATVSMLVVSGLSCFSSVAGGEVSAPNGVPKAASEFMSYITPDHPEIVATLQAILGNPPYEISQFGFDNIRTWVADEIDYMSDEQRSGGDYWQTPEETLRLGTGDCEDFSILLCSLLRAYGIAAEQVYVAIGVDDEKSEHAFLIEDWNCDDEWRRIEPQAPAQTSSSYLLLGVFTSHPDSRLSKYRITAAWNDLYYYNDEPFSQSEGQADVWTLTEIINVVGDALQRLAQFVGHLLGLVLD